MDKKLKISEARAKLFDLVDYVTGEDQGVVLIERRNKPERAALVSEEHLRYLYATIEGLESKQRSPFRLKGSMKLLVSPEELEAALGEGRREQAALAARKLQDR
jgi:PHD/YefM family antitoxin component YafN of YafNO toxin-antitoxin module